MSCTVEAALRCGCGTGATTGASSSRVEGAAVRAEDEVRRTGFGGGSMAPLRSSLALALPAGRSDSPSRSRSRPAAAGRAMLGRTRSRLPSRWLCARSRSRALVIEALSALSGAFSLGTSEDEEGRPGVSRPSSERKAETCAEGMEGRAAEAAVEEAGARVEAAAAGACLAALRARRFCLSSAREASISGGRSSLRARSARQTRSGYRKPGDRRQAGHAGQIERRRRTRTRPPWPSEPPSRPARPTPGRPSRPPRPAPSRRPARPQRPRAASALPQPPRAVVRSRARAPRAARRVQKTTSTRGTGGRGGWRRACGEAGR